ncbi:hypothetical protein QBC34DRAFT_339413 [Podospora aff. communis PSN243]|uniref:Uncharacterized protein n=1 Tax=Podospora aff. communis PSN243 TaxID=3040156 RepID=A0AAV9FV79_9PEZI|nr:hypothetical protein QBC34DRAFT_339413 [Podospora aff. communis PSN243]
MVRSMLTLALFSFAALGAGANLIHDDRISNSPEIAARSLVKRSCDQGSWRTTRDAFTMTANGSQALFFGVEGPSRILVTKTRKASWSNTMGLSFEDAKSLNTSFELKETLEDSTEHEVIALPGQFGHVAFTAILLCETGTATCNGAEVSGDICTPRVRGNGNFLDGVINVVTTS